MTTTTIQTRRLGPPGGDWTASTAIDLTDPALGVLSATLALTSRTNEVFSVVSQEGGASTASISAASTIVIGKPDGITLLTGSAGSAASVQLGAATGANGGAGDGASFVGSAAGSGLSTVVYGAAEAPGSPLVGLGTVTLGVTASTLVLAKLPGNVQAAVKTMADATVQTQVVTRDPPGGPPAGAGGVDVTGGGGLPLQYFGASYTPTQTQSLVEQKTGRTGQLTFQQFDGSLGTLLSVDLTLTITSHGSYTIENDTARAQNFKLTQAAAYNLLRPDGTVAVSASLPTGMQTVLLAGTGAVTGTLGDTYAYARPLDGADLAQFVGVGTTTLAVTGTGTDDVVGPSAFRLGTTLTSGLVAQLSYVYQPGTAPAAYVPDPAIVAAGQSRIATGTLPSIVAPGGTLIVTTASTGGAAALVVNGTEIASGSTSFAVAQTVNGTLSVAAGASVSNATIAAPGTVTVDGTIAGTTLAGLGIVRGSSSGGTVTGTEYVYGQSTADTVTTGGKLIVSGAASSTKVLGGTARFLDGSYATDVTIGAGGSVDIGAAANLNGLDFAGPGTVTIHAGALTGTLAGFGQGDVIDLADLAYSDANAINFSGSGAIIGNVPLQFAVPVGSLRVSADAAGTGTAVSLSPTLAIAGAPGVAQEYRGPVDGLDSQYIAHALNTVASVGSDNWFLHAGGGSSALAAHGGRNVLDAGTGTAFMVGGTGQNTFFASAGSSPATWSTVVGHAGDDLTLWGFGTATPRFLDGLGAAGYKGLTIAVQSGGVEDRVTLAGYTAADLTAGRVTLLSGTDVGSGLSYINVRL